MDSKLNIEEKINQAQAAVFKFIDPLVAEILKTDSPPYTLKRSEWVNRSVAHLLAAFNNFRNAAAGNEFTEHDGRHI